MTSPLRREIVHDGVLLLTFDRPQQRNALNNTAYAALSAALSDAEADPTVRAVVLTGQGGHFTAGNDLGDFATLPEDATSIPGIRLLAQVAALKTPLVAAVEGSAVGIGTTLLLHCDLAYAGETARFRAPFVPLGLSPEGGSSLLLTSLAGLKKASEILLLGGFFSAQEALTIGLLNAVTEPGKALETALAKAQALAAQPPEALAATRALLRSYSAEAIQAAIDAEERVFLQRCRSSESQQAISAFFSRAKG
jgi:enoyl-CoA hydratase/carnithine racemase